MTKTHATYWEPHAKSWWLSFLHFLYGHKPEWLGKLHTSGRWYNVYYNEETKMKYLVDKEDGRVWQRSIQ